MNKAILKTKEFELPEVTLRNSITDVFKVLTAEIHEIMDDVGENKENYHLSIHPFSIERVDGCQVPERLMVAIQSKLQSDQQL